MGNQIIPTNVIDNSTFDMVKTITNMIGGSLFADLGVVTGTHGSPITSVDVTMATQRTVNVQYIQPDTLQEVEVLWPGNSVSKVIFPLASGDIVLIVGLRNYYANSFGIQAPSNTFGSIADTVSGFWYSFGTAKAIPLSGYSGNEQSLIEFLSNNKLTIKNQSASLYTILYDFANTIETFMGATSQASITSAGASSASLAAELVSLMSAFVSSTTTLVSNIQALLEA